MKNQLKLFACIIAFLLAQTSLTAANKVTLTIKYSTKGTISGYDHLTKMRVFSDGNELGESEPKKQTISNSVSVQVTTGSHNIKAVLFAKPDNIWEERTKDNEYSFDCVYEKEINFTENKTIELVFDFDKLKIIEKGNDEVSKTTSYTNSKTTNSTSNYKESLKKLNDYLKTFDNGYYGYFEVIDGYLYDRFKSGKYTKTPIKKLRYATVEEPKRKISLLCDDNSDCVYSTYTDSYHKQLTFSQSTDFNTTELGKLFNDLIDAYNNSTTTSNSNNNSNIDIKKSGSNSTANSTNYQSALVKLNDYLKTFDNGYYGYFEVKDGYIYDRFKAGKYNKFKMEDMEGAIIETQYSRVIFKCKSGDCISTDWKVNGKEPYTQFTKGGSYNYQELADLLNNFRDAYLGIKKQTNTSSNNSNTNKGNYQENLSKLNTFLKTFDNGYYGYLEVKDGYLYDRFKSGEHWKVKLDELTTATIETPNRKVIVNCKDYKESVFSTYTNSYHKQISFSQSTDFDDDKLVDLLNNFLETYKNGNAKSNVTKNNNSTTTKSSTKTDAEKKREQLKNNVNGGSNSNTKTEELIDDEDMDFWYFLGGADDTDNKTTTTSSTTTSSNASKYQPALTKLNDYLKIFNPSVYKGVEVNNGKVYFKFIFSGITYSSYINTSDLKNKTNIVQVKDALNNELKIKCKNDENCFYSEYSKGKVNHFRFYTSKGKDLSKIEQLVNDFIKALD